MSNVEFTSLADIKPQSVQWLWEGRIPMGKVTDQPRGADAVGEDSRRAGERHYLLRR
jgi:hypothetical protein